MCESRCVTLCGVFLAGVLAFGFTTSAQPLPTEIFVDTASAHRDADGSPRRPFASIEDARDSIRTSRATSTLPDCGITVTILPGTTQINKTITFDERDSGEPDSPIIYRAPEGHRLVGGLIIVEPELRTVADPSVLDRLPTEDARIHTRQLDLEPGSLAGPVHRGMGAPKVPIASEVIWDGVVLTRSRWPNIDAPGGSFAKVSKLIDAGSIPRNRAADIAPDNRETGEPRGGRFRIDDERARRWTGAEDAWVMGYWCWDWAEEQLPIERVDHESGEITLGLPHRYGLKQGARFYVTNLLEELDAPGEYFIDTENGLLYVWPPADQGPREIIVTTLAKPILSAVHLQHVQFKGLTFESTRGGAIDASNVRGVQIEECTFNNIGTDAIRLEGSDNLIERNELLDIGGTGITVTGGDRARLVPAHNQVTQNHIHRFGRVYRTYNPGIRLAGVGQHVANNEIHDAPHSAIIFYGNDHVIELNEIYDVLNETGDSGAIYCGRDWTLHGTQIRYNLFHHISGSDGRYQNAVYLDDMASGINVVGNVMYKCNWGMLVGGGRDVKVRANVFVDCRKALSFDARGVGWMAPNIADPATSTLHKNLAAVPYTDSPWTDRFPSLASYLTDRFGRPANSEVIGNALVRTPLGRIDDRDNVAVEGNTQLVKDWRLVEDDPHHPGRVLLNAEDLIVQTPSGPVSIPLSSIGRHAKHERRIEAESPK